MRPILILAAILALPIAVIAHRQVFLATQQRPLFARVLAALDDPMFASFRKDGVSIDYLDITLSGWVADPSVREEARRRVTAIPGVRLREQDNRLLVSPRLQASLSGERLALSGWLRDEAIVRELTRWLTRSRPGLEVDTTAVRLHPSVARVEPPPATPAGPVPAVFAEVWELIRARPFLRVEKQPDGRLVAAGALPSEALRRAVTQAVLGARPAASLDAARLRGGAFVRQAPFTREDLLPALLHSFFESPLPHFFEAGEEGVRLRGQATAEHALEWRTLLESIMGREPFTMELRVVASPYHLPGYRPESQLAPEALQKLRAALAANCFHYESGVLHVSTAEKPRLANAAQAILAAGPAARIIVGAHLDAEGDPKLNQDAARDRSAFLIADLKALNVPVTQLEPAIFPVAPGPDGGNQSRCVELLVK